MKLFKVLFIYSIVLLAFSSAANASDFDWTKDLNIRAQADPSGFKATLATRFKIGDVHIDAVLSNVDDPADAYIMLRLGEMSGRPVDYVVKQYRSNKDKGWGALAKSLGIKPGSQEFHALKRGHDLTEINRRGKVLYSSYDHGSNSSIDDEKRKNKEKK
jgi:hypothetical protein